MAKKYLTVTRRVGERINIGQDIEIVLTSIQGKQARISVSAPKDVKIERTGTINARKQDQ